MSHRLMRQELGRQRWYQKDALLRGDFVSAINWAAKSAALETKLNAWDEYLEKQECQERSNRRPK